jgi:hypothetical protein
MMESAELPIPRALSGMKSLDSNIDQLISSSAYKSVKSRKEEEKKALKFWIEIKDPFISTPNGK